SRPALQPGRPATAQGRARGRQEGGVQIGALRGAHAVSEGPPIRACWLTRHRPRLPGTAETGRHRRPSRDIGLVKNRRPRASGQAAATGWPSFGLPFLDALWGDAHNPPGMAIHRAVPASSKNLGVTLLEAGVITPEMLVLAEARAGDARERIGDALVELGAASEDDVLRALAAQRGLAFLSAEELPFTPPVLKNLSPKYLRQYAACPIAVEGSTATVATADPTNPLLVDELRQTLALNIALCVAPRQAILEAIERTYGASTALQKIVEGMGPTDGEGDREEDITQLRDMAFEAPVVRLVNLLIEEAVASEASDIHIEPSEDTLRVRYRIDGILYDLEAPPRRLQAAVTSRIKLMAELNIAERRLPQDGRIRMTLNGRRIDIRVSSVPTIHGESIVMRLLDRSSVFMPFDKLGFSPAIGLVFDRLINQPIRIVLVTGPTGSGKTTTLYAALDKINVAEKKIITIEDPVEYQLKGVNQIA